MKEIKKKLVQLRVWFLMSWYVLFYNKETLKKAWILMDSKNGKDLGSNMLRIAEELTHNPAYRKYRLFISCNQDKKADLQKMAAQYELRGVTFIREGGFRYAKVAALAGYIFTDTSLPLWFVKKKGQVIANTWHGTPLKMMGKDVYNRAFDMGNVQKNHLIADYLIYPSDYMKACMTSAYFLDNLFQGKILCSGYPRNSIFFDRDREGTLRGRLGLEGKRLYGYMPTWRGVLKRIDANKNTYQVEYFLQDMDKKFEEDEIFFVRLHPFIGNTIDYSRYKHIRPFPEGYEPYDILNICDCMVTDYSSVMFDFANSGKKIVLFVYDKELYMDERGVYVSMDTFPFPQVRRVDDLLKELRSPKQYDDRKFLEKFCQYDQEGVAERLCRHIIKGEKVFQELCAAKNGKENVLIYSGNLSQNGLTTALLNLFSNIDLGKRNYYVTFKSLSLKKEPERVAMLPPQVGFYPIAFTRGESLGEAAAIFLYYEKNVTRPFVAKRVDRYYRRLYQGIYGCCDFGCVIQYTGYERAIINMFGQSPARRMIFVHNDMIREMETRNNQHKPTIQRAYREFDKVIPVTEDIYGPAVELGGRTENVQIVNNCHDYRAVLEKSQKDLQYDSFTKCSVPQEDLQRILDSDSRKMITIGRFSPEKGHHLLLKAFGKYYEENPDSYLIIIGGHGKLYEETIAQAAAMPCADRVIILQSISNPMPILAKCDLFVLSSLYEGLGLVILEADTLGIPVIATDVPGPHCFLTQHGGYLISPDVKGIFKGMKAFEKGKVKVMGVDYEEHNIHAVQQFEELFSEAGR